MPAPSTRQRLFLPISGLTFYHQMCKLQRAYCGVHIQKTGRLDCFFVDVLALLQVVCKFS